MEDDFLGLRQGLRKYIKMFVRRSDKPLDRQRIGRLVARIEQLNGISQDQQEIDQAIVILLMQKEIAEADGCYFVPGKVYKKQRYRSLDDEWNS